ncbi:MAG: IS3 family transposase [Acidimicrobiia bacterium]
MIDRIVTERADYGIPYAVSCRALGVSESWFYKHKNRPVTRAVLRRECLDAAIRKVFVDHDGTYGSPRVTVELRTQPAFERVGENTVARRMRALGLVGKPVIRRRSLTRPDRTAPKFADLVRRSFNPPAPDQVWCGDITEIRTWEGNLYAATVIDLYSRRLLGYAIGTAHNAALVCEALQMAYTTRGGAISGVIMHTDRGSEYTSERFTGLCARLGALQSMSRAGSCLDNAVAESFFATFKTEMVYRRVLTSRAIARTEIIRWFDRYNRTRRHSHCGNQPPITYEEANATRPHVA